MIPVRYFHISLISKLVLLTLPKKKNSELKFLEKVSDTGELDSQRNLTFF